MIGGRSWIECQAKFDRWKRRGWFFVAFSVVFGPVFSSLSQKSDEIMPQAGLNNSLLNLAFEVMTMAAWINHMRRQVNNIHELQLTSWQTVHPNSEHWSIHWQFWMFISQFFRMIWVCLKIVYPIVPNGFADHYPYEQWLFHWEY